MTTSSLRIHMLAEAIFWFHPLVWWFGARLMEERERACDEEVLRLGSEPHIYAEGILNICKLYVESPLACVSGVVSVTSGASLKKRIHTIMGCQMAADLGFAKRLLLAAAGVAAVSAPIVIGLLNTAPGIAQTPPVPPISYVASVKPNNAADARPSIPRQASSQPPR
jgi:bla regulator protein blaR1